MEIIESLLKKNKISKIPDLELERYTKFLESSYQDNLSHSKIILSEFPRWSIISGYYAMHDITKLLLAKRFRIKINFNVHVNTIKLFKVLVENKEMSQLLEKAYDEFLDLVSDLEEAKAKRVKVQYYTGTDYSKKRYLNEAKEFSNQVDHFITKLQEIGL